MRYLWAFVILLALIASRVLSHTTDPNVGTFLRALLFASTVAVIPVGLWFVLDRWRAR